MYVKKFAVMASFRNFMIDNPWHKGVEVTLRERVAPDQMRIVVALSSLNKFIHESLFLKLCLQVSKIAVADRSVFSPAYVPRCNKTAAGVVAKHSIKAQREGRRDSRQSRSPKSVLRSFNSQYEFPCFHLASAISRGNGSKLSRRLSY